MLCLVMIIIYGVLCMSLKLQSIVFCGTFILPELKLLLFLAYSEKGIALQNTVTCAT